MDIKTLKARLQYHAKRCPDCGAALFTSTHKAPVKHTCLNCGRIFTDVEALPSQAKIDAARQQGTEKG